MVLNYPSKTNPVTEQELIAACQRRDRKAQKYLFDHFSAKMYGICKRYVKDHQEAEDVLIDGMFKVLTKIDDFRGAGSFEGWIRRIMVNQSLMFLRKRNELKFAQEINNLEITSNVSVEDDMAAQEILDLLDQLPTGYRTVFNLYVVEGYKHREIAEELGISINTSKSQLILAKKRMKELIISNHHPKS